MFDNNVSRLDRVAPSTFRCPTCRALQEWSDTCRRCKCDLRLLYAAERAWREHERGCLDELRAGRPAAALRHARDCERLRPDDESRRLVAVCALLSGDWPTALALAAGRPELTDSLPPPDLVLPDASRQLPAPARLPVAGLTVSDFTMSEVARVAPVSGKVEIYCDGMMIFDDGFEPIPRSET